MKFWYVSAALLWVGTAWAQQAPEAKVAADAAQELAKAIPGAKPKIAQVAVPVFSEIGPAAAGWGTRAAELWAESLAQAAKVKVVGPSGVKAASDAKPAEIARQTASQAILAGEVTDQTDKLVVNVRLLSGTSGQVLAAAKGTFQIPAKAAAPAEAPAEAKKAPEPAASRIGGVESASIDVMVRKLSDKIAEAFAAMPGSARYRRLAVLPFSELGEGAKKRQIGAIVAAEIATNLRRDHGLLLVERAQLAQVLEESKLEAMVSTDPAAANKLGDLADAQALVIGSVSEASDKYLINARVVSTQTGQTLAAEAVQLPAAGMVALASDAVVLRSRSGAVFRSLLVPGWGQFYNRQEWKGWGFIGAEVALVAGAVAWHYSGVWAEDKYNTNTAQTVHYADMAHDRYVWRNVFIGAAAGIWALNIIDAYASGVDGQSMLSGAIGASGPSFVPLVTADANGGQIGALIRW